MIPVEYDRLDDVTPLNARPMSVPGAGAYGSAGAAWASTSRDESLTEALWADARDRLLARVRDWANRRLMPFSGLVGLTDDQRPVLYTPYHPRSGHAVFIFAQLRTARHYLDHLLYSLEATTPASHLDLHIFTPHASDSDDALFFRERADRVVLDPSAAWQQWARWVEEGIPNDHWRTLYVLVVDDLHAWAERARRDAALYQAITTVLTRGLGRRVVVLATTTYSHWFTLPEAWQRAFRVGFYGGARGLTDLGSRLPRAVRELGPEDALVPSREGRPVRFRSLAPEILRI
ncbi:MAG: hypothetical protein GXO37_03840 [Chloroflexi bacterium]|nr:hypothetical protein [Chloroflexota bacterium]